MDRTEQPIPHLSAVKIAGVYALFGVLWILFSDQLVARLAASEAQLTALQTLKGWTFVVASAGILYVMVVREHRRLIATNDDLESALQQVHILHRILRHNLRNISTIIGGTIYGLESKTGDRSSSSLDTLRRQNERLVNLSEKSRHLRDFLREDSGTPREYDLVELVEKEVTKAREQYPNARIHVNLPAEARVRAHYLIDGAVEELVENAIEHNRTDNPTVWMSARSGTEWTTLRVEDNGSGIPTSERSALRRGYETPLDHSQGLGLWLVRLTIEQSGGELSIEDSDHGGAMVVVNLPVAE